MGYKYSQEPNYRLQPNNSQEWIMGQLQKERWLFVGALLSVAAGKLIEVQGGMDFAVQTNR